MTDNTFAPYNRLDQEAWPVAYKELHAEAVKAGKLKEDEMKPLFGLYYRTPVLNFDNEVAAHEGIVQGITQRLSMYRTTIEEDTEMLKSADLSARKRTILHLRWTEKWLLDYCRNASRQALNFLNMEFKEDPTNYKHALPEDFKDMSQYFGDDLYKLVIERYQQGKSGQAAETKAKAKPEEKKKPVVIRGEVD